MTKNSRTKVPAKLHAAYEEMLDTLGSRPDVTGVDVGYKYKAGERKRQVVVRVHVAKKITLRRVPVSQRIPSSIRGIPVDVIAGSYRKHAACPPPWQRHEPLCPGVSIGNPKAELGTLGAVVFDEDTGAPCILSAFHVLASEFGADGDPITQPARSDHGMAPGDTVATLHRRIPPGTSGDAAIAKLTSKRDFVREQHGSGVVVKRAGLPSMNQLLEKSGRTTGVTRGRVVGMGTYFYAGAPGGISGFMLEMEGADDPNVEELSAPGDSGALWYDPQTKIGVGLHAAGEVALSSEFAIASFLTRVLSALRVRLTP